MQESSSTLPASSTTLLHQLSQVGSGEMLIEVLRNMQCMAGAEGLGRLSCTTSLFRSGQFKCEDHAQAICKEGGVTHKKEAGFTWIRMMRWMSTATRIGGRLPNSSICASVKGTVAETDPLMPPLKLQIRPSSTSIPTFTPCAHF